MGASLCLEGFYRVILGLYWGNIGDNGKENGSYYNGVI